MNNFKRPLNSDIVGVDLFSILKNLYTSLDINRQPFDSQEKFIAYFNDGLDLLVQNMTEIISYDIIMNRYNESRLNLTYGLKFEDIFLNSKFTAHTHPKSFDEFHKRPSDGDYFILKNYTGLHYVIDESYIYCISFLKDSTNGFYGKWNWTSGLPIYVSDEHYDIEQMKYQYDSYSSDEKLLVSNNSENIESGIFEIHKDGTIRLESNI